MLELGTAYYAMVGAEDFSGHMAHGLGCTQKSRAGHRNRKLPRSIGHITLLGIRR